MDGGGGIAGSEQRRQATTADVEIFRLGAFGTGEDRHGGKLLGNGLAQD
jgi:hypothetical protein